MTYQIKYHKLVKEDLKRLDNTSKLRAEKAIEIKLVVDPKKYGEPLKGSLNDFRKLRIGDYRIVYKVRNEEVLILGIKHRRDIYEIAKKRVH